MNTPRSLDGLKKVVTHQGRLFVRTNDRNKKELFAKLSQEFIVKEIELRGEKGFALSYPCSEGCHEITDYCHHNSGNGRCDLGCNKYVSGGCVHHVIPTATAVLVTVEKN